MGAKIKAWVKGNFKEEELSELDLARWLHSWQKAFPVEGTACAEAWRGETARVSRVLSASPCTSFYSTSTFLSHLMIVVPSKSLLTLLFSNPQPPTFSKNIVERNATQLPHRGSDLSLILWLCLKGTLLVFYFIIKVYVYIAKRNSENTEKT